MPMTARVVVRGTLSRAPESGVLKNGAPFVTATLNAKDGDHMQFWQIVAFSETVQAELMQLSDGDAVAVQGSLRAELYDKHGETELFFGIIAEHALGLRQPGKKRRKDGWAATHRGDARRLQPSIQ
jgi:single-stranded DNA-binding protein